MIGDERIPQLFAAGPGQVEVGFFEQQLEQVQMGADQLAVAVSVAGIDDRLMT